MSKEISNTYNAFKESISQNKNEINNSIAKKLVDIPLVSQLPDNDENIKSVGKFGYLMSMVENSEINYDGYLDIIKEHFEGLSGDALNEELIFLVDNCMNNESPKLLEFLKSYKEEFKTILLTM